MIKLVQTNGWLESMGLDTRLKICMLLIETYSSSVMPRILSKRSATTSPVRDLGRTPSDYGYVVYNNLVSVLNASIRFTNFNHFHNKGICRPRVQFNRFIKINLQNDGKEILWSHIARIFQEDSVRELRRTRLTAEHVYLTPQSVMRVYLAAQVRIV